MIYIISEKKDLVTDLVIEWLQGKGQTFKRLNDDDFTHSKTAISNNVDLVDELLQAKTIWHRRGKMRLLPKPIYANYPNRKTYIDYLSREVQVLNFYHEFKLKNALKDNYLGSFRKECENNKLINLAIAKEVGFNIPDTLITTTKTALIHFYQKHHSIIHKDLRAPVNLKTRNKQVFSAGVQIVNDQMIDLLQDTFAPICLQRYIPKKYEIRVFIACKKLFPMAIFSQKDQQTQVDYRNYNKKKPNRCVPVKLPEQVAEKTWAFMHQAEMNTGSMDLIVTPQNDYYFLEVNPMGQFHWLSENCNYQIEKEIAKYLSDEKN